MKAPTIILGVVGIAAVLFAAFKVTSGFFFPSYAKTAHDEFSSRSAQAAIIELFERVEAESANELLIEIKTLRAGYTNARRIPSEWIPSEFSEIWGRPRHPSREIVDFWDVLAYFDESGKLLAIEFFGSRYGCLAARESYHSFPWFRIIYRISESPLYISIRTS